MLLVHQTLGSAIAMTAATIAFLGLAVFQALKVWTLDADQYLAWIQSQRRPRNWRNRPFLNAIWRWTDSRPTALLRQTRVLSLLAVGLCLFGLVVGSLEIVRAS